MEPEYGVYNLALRLHQFREPSGSDDENGPEDKPPKHGHISKLFPLKYLRTKILSFVVDDVVGLITPLDTENAPNGEEGDEDGEDEEETGAETEAENEPELTEEEESIRANLAEGEPLPNETLDKILPPFWNEEPFR